MKSMFRWGALTALLLAIVTGAVMAQFPATTPAATKIGVVNVGLLFTKYHKSETFKKELENDLAPLKGQAEKIKENMGGHEKWLRSVDKAKKDPATLTQIETSTQALMNGKHQLENLDMEARKLIGKKQETQLVQLYLEIQTAVAQYASQNGFHMVLAYGDPPNADLNSFNNVSRKMNGLDQGGVVPFYVQNGLDLSNDVLARLNAGVQATPVGLQK